MSNFARSKGLGKWAESQVKRHLSEKENYIHIIDVSEDAAMQKHGVDFIWIKKEDAFAKSYLVDVKLDRLISRTGNIFFETLSGKDIIGNLLTSIAETFMYLDPFGKELYYIDVNNLRSWWLLGHDDVEIKTVRNNDRLTQGFCVKKEDIVKMGFGHVEPIVIEEKK